MLDTTIHAKTIARQFRRSDFRNGSWGISADDKDEIVAEAVRIATDGFGAVSLRRNTLAGKPVYRHAALSEALLTRHISEGLRRITGVKQSDRKSIVKSLKALTSEGVPFGVLKFDIRSFYETVNTDNVVEALRRDSAFSRQSISLVETFFSSLRSQGIEGLPRGISLSATLAEYVLRTFDYEIANYPGVRFYSRYVDDGIIVTSDKVDLQKLKLFIERTLPTGLNLNRSKTSYCLFGSHARGAAGNTEHILRFLGYSLTISEIVRLENKLTRTVHVDIAPSKVSKVKRRICKSLLTFNDGGTFTDLLARIRLLSSNFGFIDDSTGQQRYSGIRYNYGLIDPTNSPQLDSLDRFFINVVTSRHSNNRIRPNLTKRQQTKLLGFGFKSGFIENRFFTFSDEQLKHLIGCWAHA